VAEHDDLTREVGGEAACYAHLLCPQCGAVLDGNEHRPDCTWTFEDPLTTPVE